MLTLGIHDGHTATACVMENGKVLACISEERLNGEKEWQGFPELSILKCLEISSKNARDFDAIGFCSIMPQIGHHGYQNPSLAKRVFGYAVKVLPPGLLQREKNIRIVQHIGQRLAAGRRLELSSRVKGMGFDCPVSFYEHHHLHAVTTSCSNWYKPDECLVITLDGSGDGVCGSINIARNGNIERVSTLFNYNSICEFYTKVTQYMGLKPMSHEYKVMGMSPYAGDKYRQELLSKFRGFFKISDDDPLQIINTSGRWKWQFLDLFKDLLFMQRFDNISGAVQDFFEEVVLQWVKNAIERTGVRNIALSGGGFMNVKLNAKILELPEVETLFIFPSCGDESNPIGAAMQAALDHGFEYKKFHPLEMVYWGPEYSNEQVKIAIENYLPGSGFEVFYEEDIDGRVGREVAEGMIIGRMTGRMEWGARALGNRSILADPRSSATIHRINKAIKMRDFWMPFAPAILEESADKYLIRKDGFKCPFMVNGFKTKDLAQKDIIAGIHPFDYTARAQLVDREFHPGFYRVIKAFEAVTGVSGVLNTSFNLHGDAIVCTPEDAIKTLVNSDLDAIQMENYYVKRIRHYCSGG